MPTLKAPQTQKAVASLKVHDFMKEKPFVSVTCNMKFVKLNTTFSGTRNHFPLQQ